MLIKSKSVEYIYKVCPIFSGNYEESGAWSKGFSNSLLLGNETQGAREDKENKARHRKPIYRFTRKLRWLPPVGLMGGPIGNVLWESLELWWRGLGSSASVVYTICIYFTPRDVKSQAPLCCAHTNISRHRWDASDMTMNWGTFKLYLLELIGTHPELITLAAGETRLSWYERFQSTI